MGYGRWDVVGSSRRVRIVDDHAERTGGVCCLAVCGPATTESGREWVSGCSSRGRGRGRVVGNVREARTKLCHCTETDSSPRLAGGTPNAALATTLHLLVAGLDGRGLALSE
jgi:hypothetical protein